MKIFGPKKTLNLMLGLKSAIYQFFKMGQDGRALLVPAIKNPSQELKNLFVLGSYV